MVRKVNVEVKLEEMKTRMDEHDKDILVEALQIYVSIINTLYKKNDSEWLCRYNDFYYMVDELGKFVGWDLNSYV